MKQSSEKLRSRDHRGSIIPIAKHPCVSAPLPLSSSTPSFFQKQHSFLSSAILLSHLGLRRGSRLLSPSRTRLREHAMTDQIYAERAAACMAAVRKKNPLTHCITNMVSMDLMANVLLSAGCSPAMVHAVQEVEEFGKIPGGLLINIGTLDDRWAQSYELAVRVAQDEGKKWVLDPVGAGATSYRSDVCRHLLRFKPAVVRGNASEILALGHTLAQGSGKGVDSTDTAESAVEVAKAFALKHECVVAVSGKTDYITDGNVIIAVNNGAPMLQQITASGCAVTALVAAYIAAKPEEESVLEATAYAMSIFGLAAEKAMASGQVKGPGTLRLHLLDALFSMTDEDVKTGANITVLRP